MEQAWTEVTDSNTARTYLGTSARGTQTATLIFSGENSGTGTKYANTESWNGTSWTEVNDLSSPAYGRFGSGVQTAAIALGGTGYQSLVELWDGTSWTETTEVNTPRYFTNTAGTQTSTLISGGYAPPVTLTVTEFWNGTSWTELNDLATARAASSAGGSATAAIDAATPSPANTAAEEWTCT
jgi:hypothetical protein